MGYIFLGLVLAVTTAAFNTGNNLLYLVAAMMIASMIASFMISEYMIADVFVGRDAPDTVTEGMSFQVTYRVENKKRLVPSFAVRITEMLGGSEAMALVVYVGAGREVTVKGFAIAETRGRLEFHSLTLSTTAPFGWFNKIKRAPLSGEIIAMPRTDPRGIDREKIVDRGEERPMSRPGRGDELFGFRIYARGDPVKDIHWKTSARMKELMIREREAETERKLRLVLDLSGTRPKGDDPGREAAVRRAASLASVAVEEGWQVRVEQEGRGVDFGAGPGHLFKVLLFLALFDDPGELVGNPLPATEAAALKIS